MKNILHLYVYMSKYAQISVKNQSNHCFRLWPELADPSIVYIGRALFNRAWYVFIAFTSGCVGCQGAGAFYAWLALLPSIQSSDRFSSIINNPTSFIKEGTYKCNLSLKSSIRSQLLVLSHTQAHTRTHGRGVGGAHIQRRNDLSYLLINPISLSTRG